MPTFVSAKTRYEVMRDGLVIASYYGGQLQWEDGDANYHLGLSLDSGTYDVAINSIGHDRIVLSDVSVAGTPTIRLTMPARHWWQGILRSADGSPVSSQAIYSCDDLGANCAIDVSAGDGSFAVPITDQGFVVVYVPESGQSIFYSERLYDIDRDRMEDINLGDFHGLPDSGDAVSLLSGDETSDDRYTIAIVGDGYTTVEETFSDTNGNGIWDGVLFNDHNQNGILDSGERYSRYGEVDYPEYGTDSHPGQRTVC